MSLARRSCRRTSWSIQRMLSLSRAISGMQYPRNRFFTRWSRGLSGTYSTEFARA
jgi:hypothetical protein